MRSKSRGIRTTRKRVRSDSRSIPRPGVSGIGFGQDDDKWYSCWYCGFPCNEEREELGDSQSANNIGSESYESKAGPVPGDELSSVLTLDALTSSYALLELGADGTPRQINNGVTSVRDSGCPFCGTLNWRGDHF